MDGRGAAGAGRAGRPGRTGRAGPPPPWWPEPPAPAARPAPPARAPDAVLPWSPATDTPAGAPVRRTARPRSLRPGRRLPVPASPGGLVALSAVAALVLAVGVPVAVRGFGTSESTVTTPFLSYVPPPGWSAAPADPDAAVDAPSLTGVVHGPGYACDGEQYLRGFAAAALLPTDASAGPADRGERVARWFAVAAYAAPDGTPPEVAVAPPRLVRVAAAGRAGRRHRHRGHGPGSRPGATTVRRPAAPCSCWPCRSAAEPPSCSSPATPRAARRSPLRRTVDAGHRDRKRGAAYGMSAPVNASRSAPPGARPPTRARPPSAPPSSGP